MHSTRADLEFLADILGSIEQRTIGGPPHMRHPARYGFMSDVDLAQVVDAAMRDPIANARARRRISELLIQLPVQSGLHWKTEANPWNIVVPCED